MQSTASKPQAMRSIIKTRSQAEVQEDKKILFDAIPKTKENARKKVRFDDMQTLGLGCGDLSADELFLKEEEQLLRNKKKAFTKANPQQSKPKKQSKQSSEKNAYRDIDPDHIIEGKRRRNQPTQSPNEPNSKVKAKPAPREREDNYNYDTIVFDDGCFDSDEEEAEKTKKLRRKLKAQRKEDMLSGFDQVKTESPVKGSSPQKR